MEDKFDELEQLVKKFAEENPSLTVYTVAVGDKGSAYFGNLCKACVVKILLTALLEEGRVMPSGELLHDEQSLEDLFQFPFKLH
jgi:hypothetical protein